MLAVIDAFLAGTSDGAAICTAADAGDREGLRHAAHGLRGTSANGGADPSSTCAPPSRRHGKDDLTDVAPAYLTGSTRRSTGSGRPLERNRGYGCEDAGRHRT